VTFNYGRMTSTADRMIERFGVAGTLRRRTTTGPAYDPTEGSPVNHACRFVVSDYSATEIDGTRVLATDKKVMLAKGSLTVEPRLSDLLVDPASSSYKIVAINPLQPGPDIVMWELQVRR
jgi:hypothetical protein